MSWLVSRYLCSRLAMDAMTSKEAWPRFTEHKQVKKMTDEAQRQARVEQLRVKISLHMILLKHLAQLDGTMLVQ